MPQVVRPAPAQEQPRKYLWAGNAVPFCSGRLKKEARRQAEIQAGDAERRPEQKTAFPSFFSLFPVKQAKR